MQSTIRDILKSKRHFRSEFKQIQEEMAQNELVSAIVRLIVTKTFAGVQSLRVYLEPNRVTLAGICESYYIKQLAQQSIMGMIGDKEIVNDIAVI